MITHQIRAWKWLDTQVAQVPDPMLRRGMMSVFRQNALRDWGYCPGDDTVAQDKDIVLDEWEQELLEDIKTYDRFGVNVRRNKSQAIQSEATYNMGMFIRDGGTLEDIPAGIRTPTIERLYFDTLYAIAYELRMTAHDLLNR